MAFSDDLKLEEDFYNRIFKPYLNSRNNDSVFIRFNSKNVVYESLQKEYDIDIVLDNGKDNITLSLKTVRKLYSQIFFETISNCTKGTLGWGYYSKADYIVYSMGDFVNGFFSVSFKTNDIIKIDVNNFKVGYGKTFSNSGKLLYKTEGRLVPLSKFKHIVLFGQKQSLKYLT